MPARSQIKIPLRSWPGASDDAPVAAPRVVDERSQPKLAVRTQTHQIKLLVVRLAVDQHQIGLDVTVSVILPLPGQTMVAIALWQRLIGGKPPHCRQ